MTETNAEVQEQTSVRKVQIISTVGNTRKTIEFSGSKWKDLKQAMINAGYSQLENMKCVESINRHTLDHPEGTVPEGDFNLFLFPVRSKAGSERSDAYAVVKSFSQEDPEGVRSHFGNYTQKSTGDILSLIESYSKKASSYSGSSSSRAVAKGQEKKSKQKTYRSDKAKSVADVVDTLSANAHSKEEKHAALYEEFRGMSTDDKLFFVATILIDLRDALHGRVPVPAETVREESEEEKQARLQKEEDDRKAREEAERKRIEEEERKRKEKEEEDRLIAEANELAGGFSDVDKSKMRRGY